MLGKVGAKAEKVIDAMTTAQRERYAPLMQAVVAQAEASVPGGTSPEEAARIVVDAITNARPRPRYNAGRGTGMIVIITRPVQAHVLERLIEHGISAYKAQLCP